jgi:YHS domain-containing protein
VAPPAGALLAEQPTMLLRATVVLLLVLAGACSKASSESTPAPSPSETAASHELTNGLTHIDDPSLVCMVNDTFMGKAQIAVEVEGKTYYGCCEMCKGRLASEPATRTAVDPVSGAQVDKATAVMAKDADGNILYFASHETLRSYR